MLTHANLLSVGFFYVSLNLIMDMCLHGGKFVVAIESFFFLVFFFNLRVGLRKFFILQL